MGIIFPLSELGGNYGAFKLTCVTYYSIGPSKNSYYNFLPSLNLTIKILSYLKNPDFLPTSTAVRALSPVTMTEVMAASFNSFKVGMVSGFRGFSKKRRPRKVRPLSTESLYTVFTFPSLNTLYPTANTLYPSYAYFTRYY